MTFFISHRCCVLPCHGLPAFFFALDPTKYFGCELGAQTQIDLKNERYIVNGSHDADKLQEILDGFIEKFVLCPDCENPETVLVMCYYFIIENRASRGGRDRIGTIGILVLL